MSVETAEELAALRAAGRVVAETLRMMRRAIKPGVTTASLMRSRGASSSGLVLARDLRSITAFPGLPASASTTRPSMASRDFAACVRGTWSSST